MSISDQLKEQKASFKKSDSVEANGDLITGVSVPVQIERNGGKLRLQVHLGAEALSSPEALNAALDGLEDVFDLDVWQPKGSQGGNGFKSGGYGGGYNKRRY